jgi:putative nucleotidyltransferase with HDIG domain
MPTIWKNVDDVRPGDVLADDVFDALSFTLIFKKGTELDKESIEILKRRGIKRVPVAEKGEESEDIILSVEKAIIMEEDFIIPGIPPTITEKTYNESFEVMTEVVSKLFETEVLDKDKVQNVANKIVAEVFGRERNVLNLIKKHASGFLYKHLVNTGVISGMIAVEMGMPIHEAIRITEAGMLHDIGLGLITSEAKNDIEKLDDDIMNHPAIGAKFIRNAGMPSEVTDAVLFHHERWDGKGFPMGLKGKRIPTIARIIAVADAYDTLTSEDLGEKSMPPYYAMRWIISNSKRIFDPDIVSTFVQMVGVYPTGTRIVLNDGREGIVVGRSEKLLKPIVDVEGDIIDLSKETDLWIAKVL